MQEDSIIEIDKAALGLIQALEKNAHDLACCLDMNQIQSLRDEIINLRRMLLGLEMGMLYQHQDYDQKMLARAVSTEKVPVNQVAVKVIEQIEKKK